MNRAKARALRAKRREMREVLARRRQAAREELEQRRQAAREELDRRRQGTEKGRENKRRRWWLLLVLALILLALLPDCNCSATRATGAATGPAPSVPVQEEPVVSPPAPTTARVARRDRPEYRSEPPAPLPWIASFRLQVAARGPRLAECFVGAQRPGTLKWTTSVEPAQGRVSDHTLEPSLLTETLSRQQRACVVGVLSDPPYRLETGDERSTPSRVGMVIEF